MGVGGEGEGEDVQKKIEWPIDYTDLLRILHVALTMYI